MENINWDQYEPVDETPAEVMSEKNQETTESPIENGVDWSKYEPVEEKPKPKRKGIVNDVEWMRAGFPYEDETIPKGEQNLNTLKAVGSGLTAGFSEMIPGFEVNNEIAGSTVGKVAGSLAPIGLLSKAVAIPLRAAAALSPRFVPAITALGDMLGLGIAGGTFNALEESAQKSIEKGEFVPPSPETIAEEGGKWVAIDAGLRALGMTGRFAKALWDKSRSAGKGVEEVLSSTLKKVGTGDKAAEKALADLEGKSLEQITKEVNAADKAAMESLPEQVEKRASDLKTKKIEQKDFTKLEKSMPEQSKAYLPAEFESAKIAEEAIGEDLTQKIENVSQRAPSERELGQNIKNDLEAEIKASKKHTDELYDIAKNVESTTSANLEKTATAIINEIKKLQAGNLKLSPAGYKEVEKKLLNTLEDLGYGITQDELGAINGAVQSRPIPLSQSIEVKKRLNKVINYDLVETGAQDFLKGPAAALREDIRSGYGPKDSVGRRAYERAEKEFGEIAEKKGKKSITGMRLTEKPESIAKAIKTPSGLSDVKDVVSKEQFAQIERELLEHMKGLNEERAAKYYREVRSSLNPDTRNIAEEIIASKAPIESPTRRVAQRNKIQEMVIDDIAKASVTGQRADKALDLWKTKEGQQLIKHALENNPNKKEVLKYLTDQSFNDFHASIVSPDGTINFKKMNELLRDPATAENIRLVAGDEGLSFLKQLEQLTERFNRNRSFIEGRIDKASRKERKEISNEIEKLGKERFKKGKEKRANLSKEEKLAEEAKEKSGLIYKFDDWLKSYGWKAKGLLTALGILNVGAVPALTTAAGWEIFSRLAKNKTVRESLKKAAVSSKSPISVIRSFDALLKAEDGD